MGIRIGAGRRVGRGWVSASTSVRPGGRGLFRPTTTPQQKQRAKVVNRTALIVAAVVVVLLVALF